MTSPDSIQSQGCFVPAYRTSFLCGLHRSRPHGRSRQRLSTNLHVFLPDTPSLEHSSQSKPRERLSISRDTSRRSGYSVVLTKPLPPPLQPQWRPGRPLVSCRKRTQSSEKLQQRQPFDNPDLMEILDIPEVCSGKRQSERPKRSSLPGYSNAISESKVRKYRQVKISNLMKQLGSRRTQSPLHVRAYSPTSPS